MSSAKSQSDCQLMYQIVCRGVYVEEAVGLHLKIVLFTCVAIFDKLIYVLSHSLPKEVSFDDRIYLDCTSITLVVVRIGQSR